MFTVEDREGVIPTVELADTAARSRATIAPSRGGMLTQLEVDGREVFYLDRATFEDRSANVRGGNPLLFPSPGKLTGDAFSWRGVRGAMKQHGFARNLPFSVVDRGVSLNAAFVRIALASSEVTRAQYPWDFRVAYTYTLSGPRVRIDVEVTNDSASEMPFGAGFHPYFAVPDRDKARAKIDTRATRAFDNTQKREVALHGTDLTAPEVDLHLIDHNATESALSIEGHAQQRIFLRGSPEFTRWVIWTIRGRDFVCLEPWTCPGDALNTGDRLIVLKPGEMRALWVEIEAG